jgi:glycerophosphoryl diester phosphodiesterase
MKRVHLPPNVNIKPPELIAHRGYALRYPENTLLGFRAAIEAGARYIECDVQLTADGIPVLLHDSDLWRTAGDERIVMDMTLDDVMRVEVNEPVRLGPRFAGVSVPLLGEFVSLLEEHRDVTAFVEIKRASLRRFGVQRVVKTVLETLTPVLDRCVPISFDRAAVESARAGGAKAVGLVLEQWSDEAKRSANDLKPDFLFCDYRMIPDDAELWPGPWHWALYEVIDAELALMLSALGAEFVETMAIKEILADRRLIPRRPVK